MALKKENEVAPVTELASKSGITPKYLEKILASLVNAGLIVSTRGREGGYALAKTPQEISVGEIFRALEDNLEISGCTAGDCSDSYCPNRNIMKKLHDGINDLLNSCTLMDMLDEYRCK